MQQDAVDAAEAARYPSVSTEVSSNKNESSYVQVSQPLWTFGKISSAIETQEMGYEVQKLALSQVKRDLIIKTAAAYAQVQSVLMKISVAQDNLKTHQSLCDRIKNRYQGQIASLADVHLATARLLQAKADLVNYKGQLKSALNELYALTRTPISAQEPIDSSFARIQDDATVKKLILEQNTDVAHANAQVDLAVSKVKEQKTSYYPTVSFRVRKYFSDYSDETHVGLVVNSSLDGMGVANYNQIQGAEKSVSVAQYELDSVRNEVERETESLLLNREVQENLRESQQESVKSLEETMESFVRQYDMSRKSWVDVLNQQRELTNMRYTLINTDLQWMTLSLQIAAMTGNLDKIAGVAL